jgi:hypothetical protein
MECKHLSVELLATNIKAGNVYLVRCKDCGTPIGAVGETEGMIDRISAIERTLKHIENELRAIPR